jgi:RimJ/RimL family protein N-acetyltransferase
MAEASFRDFDPQRDREALVDLLISEEWTHRTRPLISRANVLEELERGYYAGDDVITVIIELDGEAVGMVRADCLAEAGQDPQLDFRLRERVRGRGIGLAALRHITETIFSRHPAKQRIEGQTRRDNLAMRKVFARGGYV